MPKTCCFSTSIFSGFGLDFGGSWASKIRRAACSARRVKSYSIFAFGNPVGYALGAGPKLKTWRPKLTMLRPCWHSFRSWAHFFRSWLVLKRFLHIFGSCWSFFSGLGSLRPRFWVVWARFWMLQNHICRSILTLASTPHRNAPHATKPQFLRCLIDFGTCPTRLQNMFLA